MDLSPWTEQLRPMFTGRKVIVVAEMAAAATQTVRNVQGLGATEVLVVATAELGLGTSPTELGAHLVVLNILSDGTQLGSMRASQLAIAALPEWAAAEVEAFDPDRSAIVIGNFLTEPPTLCGRPFLFHRRPAWIALDDKTTVDALWDRCGLDRLPSSVVAAHPEAVMAVWDGLLLESQHGIVIAIDSLDGWTGGALGTRRVTERTESAISRALDGWEGPERTVRVMPFMEGVPCSIHGIVFDDFVAAMRPVEMVVLRGAEGRFVYAGCASYYDPPASDREAMRLMAKQVGAQLRAEVNYRGAFTIDGVMTAHGFRPTELNPRNGAGLVTMLRSFTEPALLLIDCIAGRVAIDWQPEAFERELLTAVDELRGGGTWRGVPSTDSPLPPSGQIVFDSVAGSAVPVARLVTDNDENNTAGLTFMSSRGAHGDFVRAACVADSTPRGPSIAPRAAAFWNWVNTETGCSDELYVPSIPQR
jgi:hypothetical protein